MMSMCRISCVVGRGCLLWSMRSLGKTLLAFALLHIILQDQTCLLLQVSLDFLLLLSSPLWWKGQPLFLMLVLEGLVGFLWTVQLHLLWRYWLGQRLLNYCDIEWFALERAEIILLFLKLHPSIAFWTLLLTLRATLFLLRDSCSQ